MKIHIDVDKRFIDNSIILSVRDDLDTYSINLNKRLATNLIDILDVILSYHLKK